MLDEEDRRRVRQQFGADDEQVRRDHLISHVLAALAADMPDRIRFFGGTALARAYLPDGRLSEDIDLIAVGERRSTAEQLVKVVTRRLAREFGRPEFTGDLASGRATRPVAMRFPGGAQVQLQLLPDDHFPKWPFMVVQLHQRYRDAGPAALAVPTLPAFVGWKTTAFLDRRRPRDLWDLAELAKCGAFTAEAAVLFRRFGMLSVTPTEQTFPAAPSEEAWNLELGHQTILTLTAAEARRPVVAAWSRLQQEHSPP